MKALAAVLGFMTVVLGVLLLPGRVRAQSAENGKDVYGPCAACHGANGEGGKQGEYPRLAGQPAAYATAQLKAFQSRKRYNLPMFPYTVPRELSETDMQDVTAYLARIQLPARTPEFKPTDSALDRLVAMERVLVVPRVSGDVAKGQHVFKQRCAGCHGANGRGKKAFPSLVGQYPNYLQRQMDAFVHGTRTHEKKDGSPGVLNKLTAVDMTNMLAWLTAIQSDEVTAEAPAAP